MFKNGIKKGKIVNIYKNECIFFVFVFWCIKVCKDKRVFVIEIVGLF